VPQGEVARVTTLSTSGSTGERKRVFFTGKDLERTVDFFACGMGPLVRAGQDTLILLGGDTEHSIARLLRTALTRLGVTGRIGAPGWSAQETLAAARTAHCLVGLPAEMLYLCRLDRSLRPESVLLSADYVPISVVGSLEDAWKCRVFSHFGMTETGFGCAVQCASGEGHHLRDPDLLLEIVDPVTGRQLAPGLRGELVLTLLRSEAMPLLRYRTGDLARLVTEPCACGGLLPRLGRVEGRRESELPLGNGRALSIHELDELLFALPNVRGFEATLCQREGRNTLFLTVEADGLLDHAALTAGLSRELVVQFRYAEVSPFSRKGKRRIHAGDGWNPTVEDCERSRRQPSSGAMP
jgi:phenylacetate-coenzyme A ligase PaaK-like adenylate-forming protein